MTIPELDELMYEIKSVQEECQRMLHPRYLAAIIRRLLRFRLCLILIVLVLVAFLSAYYMSVMGGYANTSNTSIPKDRRGYAKALTQDDLDYFARYIQLNFTLLENSYFNQKLYQSEILLTNNGVRTLPSSGWEIYFSQPHKIEPGLYPYPDGAEKPKYGVRFYFLMGNVYRMVPTERFGKLKPGEHKIVRYISEHNNVAFTDVHPNWYLASPGLEARVIESTADESLAFVSPYTSPAMWKRNTIPGDNNYDNYNPLTAADRYHQLAVEDMGTSPNPVLPSPVLMPVYNPRQNVNIVANTWVVVSAPLFANEAKYLCDVWRIQMVVKAPPSFYINFVVEEVQVRVRGHTLSTNEAYDLRVQPSINTITVRASQPAGAFYAVQTLLSLTDNNGTIPECHVTDAPRYAYRGVLIDVARNFQSKEKIYRYLDVMAMYKLNKLHFHLTDDEGWRLAVPGLEELTELGATRCHDPSRTRCLLPFLGSGPLPGPPGTGHYSVEDYRDILRYATARHIEVIPEIDMPAHSHAAIKAMEARYRRLLALNVTEASRFLLSDLQDESEYLSVQAFADGAMNPCLKSTYTFVTRVLNSLYAMHRDISPLRLFHFGGDEVPTGTWERSPACSKLRQSGINSDLKKYMVEQIANMTSLYGLDLAAWVDGVMSGGKPMRRELFPNREVHVYAWNNVWEWGTMGRAYDFANGDFKVILTPATNMYLDHPYEPDPREPGLYWATRYIDTKKVFATMPENLYMNADTFRSGKNISICSGEDSKLCPPLQKRTNIEGIQGSMFGELLRTQSVTDYMLLPRMLALSERAWHEAAWESETSKERIYRAMEKDWIRFANTLGHKELARLDRLGYKYRIPPPGAVLQNNVLKTSVTFPGLLVEMSDNAGSSWRVVEPNTQVDPEKDYLLRTRSAFGTRYSRQISLFEEMNIASLPFTSAVVMAMGLTTSLCVVTLLHSV
ncbi:hypothetical protein BsWGS_11650 [Bradybaena similaris]